MLCPIRLREIVVTRPNRIPSRRRKVNYSDDQSNKCRERLLRWKKIVIFIKGYWIGLWYVIKEQRERERERERERVG